MFIILLLIKLYSENYVKIKGQTLMIGSGHIETHTSHK